MFPDFIGIGAQKAGTTWLHLNLQAHPQIWIPRKEIHYFDTKIRDRSSAVSRLFGKRGADKQWRQQVRHWTIRDLVKNPSLKSLLWDLKFFMKPYDDRWYASLFEANRGRVAGEITPAYSALKGDVIAHVHELMPGAKIIFMMRNPIERVWSQAVMNFDKKGSAKSVREKRLFRKLERDSVRLLTDYERTLENWGAFYPPEQIFVGFLEDVHFRPAELLGALYAFLGTDPSFRPPSAEKKVHSRSSGQMPLHFASHLARSYREEAERLGGSFGGYASFWAYSARRLSEEGASAEGAICYPLYESRLWQEWAEAEGKAPTSLVSGPLSSIQNKIGDG